MPFTINWEERGVVTVFHGIVDILEVLEADRCFYNDSRSDAAEYQITDFTQGELGEVDESLIGKIAALDFGASQSIPNLKVALIATDPYVKELCKKYIELSQDIQSSWEFKIFEDMDTARSWVFD